MQRLWYVAYGTNLSRERFIATSGGAVRRRLMGLSGLPGPAGPGVRRAGLMPGGLRFVGVSSVWGGGLAVYDGEAEGEVAARAYLISAEQFVDVFAQETRRTPGLDLDLSLVRKTGRHSFGSGHYQTLANVGERDGLPMLTFTSARLPELADNSPSAGYLRTMAVGLAEAHGWSPRRIARYLGRFPGTAGAWTEDAIESLPA